ncbi:MAG: hypothetical protein ACOH2H_21005 [Cypionkella sp.]
MSARLYCCDSGAGANWQHKLRLMHSRRSRRILTMRRDFFYNALLLHAFSLASVIILSTPGKGVADEAIKITNPDARTEIVDIAEPTVNQASKNYPNIVFLPGDTVAINAGGCVQTGGAGRTWKRYVNPSGPNADHLYHGLVSIPGATIGLTRLQDVQGGLSIPPEFKVANGAPLTLTLGYEDDDYSDNGYWGHDPGTDNQCGATDGGNAWLELTITHNAAQIVPAAPYDVTFSAGDANLLPLNPRWGKQDQANEPGLPGTDLCGHPWETPCTTQSPSIVDLPFPGSPTQPLNALCDVSGPLGHHVNWGVATYEGAARWDGHSTHFDAGIGDFFGADDDYNINLWRTDQSFYTQQNPNDVHTEFDSDETIDHFTSPWWQKFHDAVDNGDPKALIDGKDIIEIGVIGLDCAHSCGSEIHPVLGMAIHVNNDPADDTWAIFARNEGNEGWCSVDTITAPELTTMFVTLPAPAGTVAVTSTAASMFEKSDGTDVKTFAIGDATAPTGFGVEIDLGDPNNSPLVNGEIHLHWSVAPPVAGANSEGGKVLGNAARILTGRVAAGSGLSTEVAGTGGRTLGGLATTIGTLEPEAVAEPEEVFVERVAQLPVDRQLAVKKLFATTKLAAWHWTEGRPEMLSAAPSEFVARTQGGTRLRIGIALDRSRVGGHSTAFGAHPVALGRTVVVPDPRRIDYYNNLAALMVP